MRLITELTEEVKYTTEETVDESTGQKRKNLYLEGVFLQAGIVNRNKRIYPTEILAGEVKRVNEEMVLRGRGYGELGHPNGPQINLDRVAILTTNLRQEGNDFYGKARVTSTPFGEVVRGLMESGGKLGVSSRGMGTLTMNKQGVMEVQRDFRLATPADVVADPSAPAAWVNGIYEGAEWAVNPDGSWRKVAEVVEGVRSMTRAQLEEGAVREFKRYMRILGREILS